MNKINVDRERKLAYVQSGCTWAEFNEATTKENLVSVGTTSDQPAIGGVLVGGGYGFLTGQYGLAIDCLVEATVVVADGRIVKASDSENPDLYWGIRGKRTRQSVD